MECPDIFPGISHMPQGTFRHRSSHFRLGAGKPRSDMTMPGLAPA